MTFTIPSEVHTDDHANKISFDALPWFQQASAHEIKELYDCGWGGDYASDVVAEESVIWFPEIQTIFDHHNQNEDLSGFECSVCEDSAQKWIALRMGFIVQQEHKKPCSYCFIDPDGNRSERSFNSETEAWLEIADELPSYIDAFEFNERCINNSLPTIVL